MSYHYAIIGSGRQGTAAAYDLARNGQATKITMLDKDENLASKSAERVNGLVGNPLCTAKYLDAGDSKALEASLRGVDGFISAVPFEYNAQLTEVAIRARVCMVDMGGNEEVVLNQLARNEDARKADISVIPDCGMGPGMTGSLAAFAIDQLDEAQDVFIWDGGLPQNPEPPWNYALTFHINGLTNEYDGMATFLRDGQTVRVPTLTEIEEVDFPPLGRLEAFVTSGGTATAIQAYRGKLRTYQNKTLRYRGHCALFQAYKQLGIFSSYPIDFKGIKLIPREVFHHLLEPHIIAPPGFQDICLIRVLVQGQKRNNPHQIKIELIDRCDPKTGFTAMERLTGWHAAIMLSLAVRGEAKTGVIGCEKAVDSGVFMQELQKRGFSPSVEHILSS